MAKNSIIRPADQRLIMWIVAALIKSECNSAIAQSRNPLTSQPFYGRNQFRIFFNKGGEL